MKKKKYKLIKLSPMLPKQFSAKQRQEIRDKEKKILLGK